MSRFSRQTWSACSLTKSLTQLAYCNDWTIAISASTYRFEFRSFTGSPVWLAMCPCTFSSSGVVHRQNGQTYSCLLGSKSCRISSGGINVLPGSTAAGTGGGVPSRSRSRLGITTRGIGVGAEVGTGTMDATVGTGNGEDTGTTFFTAETETVTS